MIRLSLAVGTRKHFGRREASVSTKLTLAGRGPLGRLLRRISRLAPVRRIRRLLPA